MRIKINGYLDNITDNNHIAIDSNGIKDKNKITYYENDIKNTIHIQESGNSYIILQRENSEFQNTIIFNPNQDTISTYLLKENNLTIELNIHTDQINITDNQININYTVLESNCEYDYHINIT